MTFQALIKEDNGQFEATVLALPDVRVSHSDRAAAIQALHAKLRELVSRGDVIEMDVETGGIMSLAGKYADDPTLQEMCDEIYRQRDRERDSLNFSHSSPLSAHDAGHPHFP